MLGYWPDAEQHPRSAADLAFARKMNALPKLVLSRTLERAEWSNTQVLRERVGETSQSSSAFRASRSSRGPAPAWSRPSPSSTWSTSTG